MVTVVKFIFNKVKIRLKFDAKPFNGKAHRIPHAYISSVKKKVDRLVELVVLNICETVV